MTLLEKLAPYLPYELEIQDTSTNKVFCKLCIKNSTWILDITTNKNHLFKPILRPLSDLFKFVDYNDGNGEVMLGYKFGVVKIVEDGKYLYVDEYDAPQCESPVACVDITAMNLWLFKYHYDLFGMIESGEAIDINTLK